MIDLAKRKLRFLVCPTRFFPEAYTKDMERAYQCWRSVWDEALTQEMNVKDVLYSDNFTRQSHVAVLFYGDEPFALTTLNQMDLNAPMYQDDSYFKVWPKEALEALKKGSRTILTCGNLALNFKFRNNALGISGKDLMFAMVVQYLKNSNFDSVVAAVRLEKGMERAAYRTGAETIAKDLPYTIAGQRVDLVCWDRNLDRSRLDSLIKNLSDYIWLNSSIVVEHNIIPGESYVA